MNEIRVCDHPECIHYCEIKKDPEAPYNGYFFSKKEDEFIDNVSSGASRGVNPRSAIVCVFCSSSKIKCFDFLEEKENENL